MSRIITNCAVTLQDSKVIKPCVMNRSDPEFAKLKQFHTGLDIEAFHVVAPYKCRIAYIGDESSGRTVVMQTGSSFCICYKHLESVSCSLNDILDPMYFVGNANQYVHVEVYKHTNSDFPVRIGSETWYKHDANLLINGALEVAAMQAYKPTYTDVDATITELTDSIFRNNAG